MLCQSELNCKWLFYAGAYLKTANLCSSERHLKILLELQCYFLIPLILLTL